MAVPKRKTSKAKRDKRRSPNMKKSFWDSQSALSVISQSFRIEFALTAITMTANR